MIQREEYTILLEWQGMSNSKQEGPSMESMDKDSVAMKDSMISLDKVVGKAKTHLEMYLKTSKSFSLVEGGKEENKVNKHKRAKT